MKTPHLILSLTTALLAGLSLAACERTIDTLDDKVPTGRACEVPNEAVTCGDDDDAVAYCGYIDGAEAYEYGPCIVPEDQECEPGDWKHEGPESSPDEEGWDDPCAGTDYACELMGGVPTWVEQECNTPLVLRFDQTPVEMIAAEATPAATFDISMREDSCITTDWPTAATPWLVVDLDQNGSIDGGHELFGSGSRLQGGGPAAHGFAALAEFDGNGDGVVDRGDPRFAELMLWRDWDADRKSTPAELEPLADNGVTRIDLDFAIEAECDERGNCGVQRSGFEFAGGVGEVVDLYLACH